MLPGSVLELGTAVGETVWAEDGTADGGAVLDGVGAADDGALVLAAWLGAARASARPAPATSSPVATARF